MKLILFLLLFLTSFAAAQEATNYVRVDGVISANAGYYPIGVGVAIGRQSLHDKFFYRIEGSIGYTPKYETGNGTTYRGVGEFRIRKNNFLVGGGVTSSYLATSAWSKGAVRPKVGVGFLTEIADVPSRVFVDYVHNGTDITNHVRGLDLRVEMPMAEKWGVLFSVTPFSYHPTNRPELGRRWAITETLGISFKF
jgi:hypothetical protein